MEPGFDLAIENAVFRMGADGGAPEHIRYGYFIGNDGSQKVIAFRLGMLESHFAHEAKRDIIAESNSIVEQQRAVPGPAKLTYEWLQDYGFDAVDSDHQRWFRF